MIRTRCQIPEGVQDFLPAECFNKNKIEAGMAQCFAQSGYDRVEPPVFEYMDVFATGIGSVRTEQMIKFIDHTGRILALRPDLTVPVAHGRDTRLKGRKRRFGCIIPAACSARGRRQERSGNTRRPAWS